MDDAQEGAATLLRCPHEPWPRIHTHLPAPSLPPKSWSFSASSCTLQFFFTFFFNSFTSSLPPSISPFRPTSPFSLAFPTTCHLSFVFYYRRFLFLLFLIQAPTSLSSTLSNHPLPESSCFSSSSFKLVLFCIFLQSNLLFLTLFASPLPLLSFLPSNSTCSILFHPHLI